MLRYLKNQRYAWEKPSVDSISIDNLTFIYFHIYSKYILHFSFCFQVVDSDVKRLGRGRKERNTSKFIAMVIFAHAGLSMSNVKINKISIKI